jgi:hypothetical protein
MDFEIPSWVHSAAQQRVANFQNIQSSGDDTMRYNAVLGEYAAQKAMGATPEIDVRKRGKGGRNITLHFHEGGYRTELGDNSHEADFTHNGQPHEIKTAKYVNRAELRALPPDTNIVRVWGMQTDHPDPRRATRMSANIGTLPAREILTHPAVRWFDDNNKSRDAQEPDGIRKQADVSRLPWKPIDTQ